MNRNSRISSFQRPPAVSSSNVNSNKNDNNNNNNNTPKDSFPSNNNNNNNNNNTINNNEDNNTSSKKHSHAIAQDHDDEAEDQLLARNPSEHPYPSFEPAGEDAKKKHRSEYQKAKQALRELRNAPAVVAIQAPLETDRPSWKAAITIQHNDPSPLDLRTEKHHRKSTEAFAMNSPNAYLLAQSRPRWVSIAQTKLVSGCPSRGIPLEEAEAPSARSARKSDEKRMRTMTGRSVASSSNASHHTNHHIGSSSRGTSLASGRSTQNARRAAKRVEEEQEQQSARSLTKLLNQMDAQAAGTRTHMPREEKVLNFLKESSSAQSKIKQMILDPENCEQVPVEQFAQSTMMRSRRRTVANNNHVIMSQNSNGSNNTNNQNQEQLTFEDLTRPKDSFFGSNNVSFLPDISTNNNNASKSFNPGQFASVRFNNSSSRRKSVNEIAADSEAMFAARSYRRNDKDDSPSAKNEMASSQKILVRLPKVGLQLFSAK